MGCCYSWFSALNGFSCLIQRRNEDPHFLNKSLFQIVSWLIWTFYVCPLLKLCCNNAVKHSYNKLHIGIDKVYSNNFSEGGW